MVELLILWECRVCEKEYKSEKLARRCEANRCCPFLQDEILDEYDDEQKHQSEDNDDDDDESGYIIIPKLDGGSKDGYEKTQKEPMVNSIDLNEKSLKNIKSLEDLLDDTKHDEKNIDTTKGKDEKDSDRKDLNHDQRLEKTSVQERSMPSAEPNNAINEKILGISSEPHIKAKEQDNNEAITESSCTEGTAVPPKGPTGKCLGIHPENRAKLLADADDDDVSESCSRRSNSIAPTATERISTKSSSKRRRYSKIQERKEILKEIDTRIRQQQKQVKGRSERKATLLGLLQSFDLSWSTYRRWRKQCQDISSDSSTITSVSEARRREENKGFSPETDDDSFEGMDHCNCNTERPMESMVRCNGHSASARSGDEKECNDDSNAIDIEVGGRPSTKESEQLNLEDEESRLIDFAATALASCRASDDQIEIHENKKQPRKEYVSLQQGEKRSSSSMTITDSRKDEEENFCSEDEDSKKIQITSTTGKRTASDRVPISSTASRSMKRRRYYSLPERRVILRNIDVGLRNGHKLQNLLYMYDLGLSKYKRWRKESLSQDSFLASYGEQMQQDSEDDETKDKNYHIAITNNSAGTEEGSNIGKEHRPSVVSSRYIENTKNELGIKKPEIVRSYGDWGGGENRRSGQKRSEQVFENTGKKTRRYCHIEQKRQILKKINAQSSSNGKRNLIEVLKLYDLDWPQFRRWQKDVQLADENANPPMMVKPPSNNDRNQINKKKERPPTSIEY